GDGHVAGLSEHRCHPASTGGTPMAPARGAPEGTCLRGAGRALGGRGGRRGRPVLAFRRVVGVAGARSLAAEGGNGGDRGRCPFQPLGGFRWDGAFRSHLDVWRPSLTARSDATDFSGTGYLPSRGHPRS